MIPAVILPTVRRAMVDLLADIGGDQNEAVFTEILRELGHQVARRDVAEQFRWLAQQGLVEISAMGPYLVASLLPDGLDVAHGTLRVDGVSRHKTR